MASPEAVDDREFVDSFSELLPRVSYSQTQADLRDCNRKAFRGPLVRNLEEDADEAEDAEELMSIQRELLNELLSRARTMTKKRQETLGSRRRAGTGSILTPIKEKDEDPTTVPTTTPRGPIDRSDAAEVRPSLRADAPTAVVGSSAQRRKGPGLVVDTSGCSRVGRPVEAKKFLAMPPERGSAPDGSNPDAIQPGTGFNRTETRAQAMDLDSAIRRVYRALSLREVRRGTTRLPRSEVIKR